MIAAQEDEHCPGPKVNAELPAKLVQPNGPPPLNITIEFSGANFENICGMDDKPEVGERTSSCNVWIHQGVFKTLDDEDAHESIDLDSRHFAS